MQGASYPRAHARFARQNAKSRVQKSPVRAPRAPKSLIARCERRNARHKIFCLLQNLKWLYLFKQMNIYPISIVLIFFCSRLRRSHLFFLIFRLWAGLQEPRSYATLHPEPHNFNFRFEFLVGKLCPVIDNRRS